MKIVSFRRTVLARMACPVCHEPARHRPPHQRVPANGPHPSWSHVDGEPLCPVVGADGYRPARRACMVTALRPSRPHRPGRTVTRRIVQRRPRHLSLVTAIYRWQSHRFAAETSIDRPGST